MEEKKLKIFHLPVSENATNTLRIKAMKKVFEQQELAEVFIYDPKEHEELTESDLKHAISEADLIMARETPTPMALLVREKFPRKRFVYDLDDNPWEVLPSSTAYKNLGIEDVIINNKPVWMTGITQGFNRYKNIWNLIQYDFMVSQSDLVTTTSIALAEKIAMDYSKETRYIPLYIDFENYPDYEVVSNTKKKDEFRIVWNGGSSHPGDLQEITEALATILEDKTNTYVNVGYWHKRLDDMLPEKQVIRHDWVEATKLPFVIKADAPDCAIIPIQSLEHFNAFKSPNKFVEYAAMRVPIVVKDSAPYNQVARNEYNCLTYKNNGELIAAVKRLKNDRKLRKHLADNAYALAQKYSLQDNAKNIVRIYKDFIESYKK